MVQAQPEELQFQRITFCEAARECNRTWAIAYDLEKAMADQQDANGNFDFDELLVFIEVLTKDPQVLTALRSNWQPRRLMLFLVNLANQGIAGGAYLLSKLYSRGVVRHP